MGVFEHIYQWYHLLLSIFGWPCGVRGPVSHPRQSHVISRFPTRNQSFPLGVTHHRSSIHSEVKQNSKNNKHPYTSMIFQWSNRSVPRIIFNIIQRPFFHWEKPYSIVFFSHWIFATDATDFRHRCPTRIFCPGKCKWFAPWRSWAPIVDPSWFRWMDGAGVTGDFWQIYDTCVVWIDVTYMLVRVYECIYIYIFKKKTYYLCIYIIHMYMMDMCMPYSRV